MIKDIVVDSDPHRVGAGFANSIGFGTTPEGFPDNIRIVYGLNSSGKTSMLRTIHELFRTGDRGKHVLHDRIAGDFTMVEEIRGRSRAEAAGKTLLDEAEKGRGKGTRVNPFPTAEVLGGPVGNRLRAVLGVDLLCLPIDRFPEESREALRRIGDGTHSWAYHYDTEGHFLETRTLLELKDLLREQDLPTSGAKADLVKLLQDYDSDVLPLSTGGGPAVKEYLFIDRGAITKRVTRKLNQWNQPGEKPHDIEVTVLGRSILPKEVFEFPEESAKAFGRLYLEAVPASELPDTADRIPQMKIPELQDELKRLALPYTGKKERLAKRLYQALRKEAWKQRTPRVVEAFERHNQYEVWNRWEIHEEMCFPGLDYRQTAELFEDTLPCTSDDIRELDSKISAFDEMLVLSDKELSSVIELMNLEIDADAESLRTAIRNQSDEHKDRRQTQLENLQKVLSRLSSVSPMKFSFCQDEFTTKDKHMNSTYEQVHGVWSVNGFRLLTDWWKVRYAEHSVTREFKARDLTRFSTVLLDVDRVAIDHSSGVVEKGLRRESAVGLERKIRDFWGAYPSYERVEVHFKAVRKALRDARRQMLRSGKKKFDVEFPAPNEYQDGTYLGSNIDNIWLLDTESVDDKLQDQFFDIRHLLSQYVENIGRALPNHSDPELYIHRIDEDQARHFVMVNVIAAVIEPALNILRMGKEFTGHMFRANETYPPFQNTKPRYYGSGEVPEDEMSSGQKHLFSMFLPIATASLEAVKGKIWTDLEDTDHILVLIDEPEISLHVNWQEDLVQAVEDALRKNDGSMGPPVSVVFATHSPSILGNHLHRSSCLGPVGGDYVE